MITGQLNFNEIKDSVVNKIETDFHGAEYDKQQLVNAASQTEVYKLNTTYEAFRGVVTQNYDFDIGPIYEHNKDKKFIVRQDKLVIDVSEPEAYKKDGRFSSALMADELINKFQLITLKDTEQIMYYQGGIYNVGAETLIKQTARALYGEDLTSHQLKEIIFQVQAQTYVDREIINSDINKIYLTNGIFDLGKEELIKFNPEMLSTVKIPVAYDAEADCPKIKKFLEEILKECDIPVIQELFGYCLYRDYPIQKAVMCVGEGANGKSTLINLLKAFLGVENVSNVPLQDFDGNRFALAQLYGKLANLYADVPNKALYQTGKFKMATGGDTMYAEHKFRNGFNFKSHAKQIYSANELPEAKDNTPAFFRRWILINFPNTFDEKTANPNLLAELTTKEELSGLFNWAIKGLKRLLENGRFSHSKSAEELQDAYERLSNSLLSFIKDEVERDVDGKIAKDSLYNAYSNYCREHNLPIRTKTAVGRELAQHIPVTDGKVDKKRGWIGIRLKGGETDSTDITPFSNFM